jgi:[NiFe] hydrogenase small subunit
MDKSKQNESMCDDLTASRRDFLKFCSVVGIAIGLGPNAGSKVAAALTAATRPPVLWLHFSECTACTESLLRTTTPYIEDLILDTLSVDYHETLMAGAGAAVHEILTESAIKYQNQFICVVEGAIPTAENGVYGTINGKTMLSIAREICPKAKCIINIGNCSSFGGIAAAEPNPTGAKNVIAALKDLDLPQVINVPGCPPNPVAFVGVIANYLLQGTLPPTDGYLRPLFAYENSVHDQCPFIKDTDPQTGRCLKSKGCKGPVTFNNCPTVKFNNRANFPMNAGHVCIGCSEPKFWDINTPFWGLLADDTALPPLPGEIFEKEVPPVAVRKILNKNRNVQLSRNQIQRFDILGRKVNTTSDLTRNSKPVSAQGLFIDKSDRGITKRINIK